MDQHVDALWNARREFIDDYCRSYERPPCPLSIPTIVWANHVEAGAKGLLNLSGAFLLPAALEQRINGAHTRLVSVATDRPKDKADMLDNAAERRASVLWAEEELSDSDHTAQWARWVRARL